MGKKLLWKVLPVAFLAGVGSTAFTSCADEYDPAKITREDILKENYAKNWEEVFGTPDPNQDWSMAANMIAKVNLNSDINGRLLIYTTAPTVAGSTMLALGDVVDGKASVQFNATKGAQMLYARVVSENGQIIDSGYFDVIENSINMSSANTRGVATDDCNYKLDTSIEWTIRRMCSEAINDLVSNNYNSYTETSHDFGYGSFPWSASNGKVSSDVPNVYDLTNYIDYSKHDNGFTVEELKPIFSTYVNKNGETINGVFKEGVDHIAQYVKTGVLDKDAILEVDKYGEVTIDVMWRGTDYYDRFGYYYYTGDEPTAEELWNLPKYMILGPDLITNTSSLTQRRIATDIVQYLPPSYSGTFTGFEYKNDWEDLAGGGSGCSQLVDNSHNKSLLRGTKIRLAYFGEDGKSSASFNFPAGVKIGFFIYSTGTNADISNTDEKFFFSNADLTYQLAYRTYDKASTPEEKDNRNNRPFAVTFNYDGRTYLGFADESGDCDLNDLVLYADNVKPKKDITPDDLVEPETNEWLFACEDLGGSFDYDFNDVIWAVSQKYNKRTSYNSDGTIKKVDYDYGNVSIKLLAAGGTLPVELLYNGESLGELHQMFGQSPNTLYNTVNATSFQQSAVTLKVIEAIENIDINTFKDDFKISVEGANGIKNYISAYNKDGITKTPQVIILPRGWDWPYEGTCISDVYPTFVEWSSNVTKTDWVKSPTGSFIDNPYGGTNNNISNGGNNGSGSGEGGNQGGGSGSQITPSGTTTYSGDALEAIKSNGVFVVPASACQTATACTVKLTFVPNDQNYVELNAWSTVSYGALFESPNWGQTYALNNIESGKEYSYVVVDTQFENINKNGMSFSTNYGLITKIEIVAE